MAAIAPITVKDGAATPVNHVFTPVQSTPLAIWRDTVSGLSLVGQNTIQMSLSAANGDLTKARIVVTGPALEAVSGVNASGYTAAPKKAYEVKFDITVFLPTRALPQQRKDVRTMVANLLLSDAQVIDVLDNGVQPY